MQYDWMAMSDLRLAAEFPELSRADWMKRVEAVLKGASFEEKLVRTTADGIRLEPLYGQQPGPRAARAQQVPWTVFQRVDHPDAARANELALDDLANGATGLVLVAQDAATARGYRHRPGAARARAAGRSPSCRGAARSRAAASMALAELIATQPIDPERLNVSFALTSPADAAELARLGYAGPYMEADGRSWHEQGATEAEELGATLATAVATHARARRVERRASCRAPSASRWRPRRTCSQRSPSSAPCG